MEANAVRAARKRLGLSQDQLARALGVTRQTVYLWERGERTAPGRLLEYALRWLEHERVIALDGVALDDEVLGMMPDE